MKRMIENIAKNMIFGRHVFLQLTIFGVSASAQRGHNLSGRHHPTGSERGGLRWRPVTGTTDSPQDFWGAVSQGWGLARVSLHKQLKMEPETRQG